MARKAAPPGGAPDDNTASDARSDSGDNAAGASVRPASKKSRKFAGDLLRKAQYKELTAVVREGRKADKAKAKKATTRRGARKARAAAPAAPTGAPPWELTEEHKGQIKALAGFGMSLEETAVILGVSFPTLLTRKAEIAVLREEGLSLAKSRVRQSVYQQAVAGSLGHARFFEERVLGYIPNQRTEHTGPGGGPVETVGTVRVMSDDEVVARLRTLVDRTASVTAVAPGPVLPTPDAL